MREFLVYCAGPITGLTFGAATDWRKYVASKFPPHIIAVSPLRGKHYLASEENIKDSYEHITLSSQRGITVRDRYDVYRADAVLVNFLGATKVSIGTVMEIAWANAFGKPTIVAMDPGNIHSHAILRECSSFIVPSLDEAIHITNVVLTPEL